jgi:hypothetical protein
MLRTIVALGALASASAFAPMGARPMGLARASAPRAVSARGPRMQVAPSKIEQEVKLTPEIFKQLDVDGGGSIDVGELKAIFGNNSAKDIDTLMKRADLDGNGELDYAEYERVMNMQKFGDAQGGNLYVRNAINLGLLKSDSILADGEASILVGNKGFDPLNCATNMETLKQYREAELKHGRLAMLAAAGWPVSELVQPWLSKALGAPDLLVGDEKAPSLVNGGLDKINPLFFMGIIIFSATVESVALKQARADDYIPGDLGFDPLGLYTGKAPEVQRSLELKELNNGRLAMLAITYYALEEFVTKASVVNDTPFLFKSFL